MRSLFESGMTTFLLGGVLLHLCGVVRMASGHCITIHIYGKKSGDCKDSRMKSLPTYLSHDIKILQFHNNNLTILAAHAFLSYKELQEIYLNNNQIREINRKAFFGVLNLQHLDLSDNRLDKVPSRAFTDIPYLRVLILKGNPLGSIEGSVFWATDYLEKLDLENCQLEHVSPESFQGLSKLTQLNLIKNRITTLDSAMQDHIPPNLNVLRIHGNPWNCDCKLRWFKVWLTEKKINWVFGTNAPICSDPASLEGLRLQKVDAKELACVPQIKRPNRTNLYVESNMKITIKCHVFADPKASVSWYFNKDVIDLKKSTGKFEISQTGAEHAVTALSILNFQTTDIGDYQCQAKNKAGTTKASFSLKMIIPPISTTLVPKTTTQELDNTLSYASIIAISAGALLFLLLLMCFICYGLKRRDRRNTYKVRDYKKPQKGKKKKRKDHELVFEGKSDECDIKNETKKVNNRTGDKIPESRTIKVGNGHATTVIDPDSSTETEPLNPIPPIPPPPKPMRIHQTTREPTPDLLRGDHNDTDKDMVNPYPSCASQNYINDPYVTFSGKTTKNEKNGSKMDKQCTSPTISHPNVSYRKLPNNIPAPPASARPYLTGGGRGTNSPVSVNGGRGTPTHSGRNTPTGFSSPVHHTPAGFKGHNGNRSSPTLTPMNQKENNLNSNTNKEKNNKNCNVRTKKSPSPDNLPSIYTEDEPAPVKIILDKTKTDNKVNNKKQHPPKPGEKDDFGTAV